MSGLEQVRRAAVELFAERGFAATGIRDIGRAVGLNSATLYHYVGSKEDLLIGMLRESQEDLLRAGRDAFGGSADPAIQLARLVRAHVATEAVNPLISRVSDHEVHSLTGRNRELIVSLRDDYESLFQRALARGAQTGQFLITDVPVARYALLEMCNGVADWYHPDGRLSVAELQDLYSELACRMVGGRLVARAECEPAVVITRLGWEPAPRTGTEQASA